VGVERCALRAAEDLGLERKSSVVLAPRKGSNLVSQIAGLSEIQLWYVNQCRQAEVDRLLSNSLTGSQN